MSGIDDLPYELTERAFPVNVNGATVNLGMTLRDYFAGQALVALIAHPEAFEGDDPRAAIAHTAYEIADAMLKERAL